MLTSTAAILHDNMAHGDDNYVQRTLANGSLLDAVMDGVTGRRGNDASRRVAEALNTASLTSLEDIVAVLEETNQGLYQRGWGRFFLTTVSVAFCQGQTLSILGLGDSPVLLIRTETTQALFHHNKGLGQGGLTQALGMYKTLTTLYRTDITLMPGDRLVLCTDGISENIAQPALVQLIRNANSPAEATAQLQTILRTHRLQSQQGAMPGEGFKDDDWTAIVRFFT